MNKQRNIPQIQNKKSDDIYVYWDILEGMQINENYSDVIPTFINIDKPGSKVVHKFDKPIFYKVKLNRDIQQITMKIADEDGQKLD